MTREAQTSAWQSSASASAGAGGQDSTGLVATNIANDGSAIADTQSVVHYDIAARASDVTAPIATLARNETIATASKRLADIDAAIWVANTSAENVGMAGVTAVSWRFSAWEAGGHFFNWAHLK